MGYVTLEGDKCEEGWMADGGENWFVRGYAMLGLGLDSNSSVLVLTGWIYPEQNGLIRNLGY